MAGIRQRSGIAAATSLTFGVDANELETVSRTCGIRIADDLVRRSTIGEQFLRRIPNKIAQGICQVV